MKHSYFYIFIATIITIQITIFSTYKNYFSFNSKNHTTLLCLNTPDTFGKTHFISGYNHKNEQKKEIQKNDIQNTNIVLFAPDDNIHAQLLSLIEKEQKYIRIAVFTFTDKSIAKALIAAKKRGITVEIITDSASIYNRYNKINLLLSNNITIFIYNPQHTHKSGGIMHNKFALFGKNYTNTQLVWTGSLNFTRSGYSSNQENVVIIDNNETTKKFYNQFERIKKRSYAYKNQFNTVKF